MEWILLLIVAGVSLVGKKVVDVTSAFTKQDFLKKVAGAALDTSKLSGIPLTIIVTQAAHESNYGNSVLATKGNNLFGIKASKEWVGPTISLPTWENINGKDIHVNAIFRAYSTWDASIRDWYKFLQGNRYVKTLMFARTGDSKNFFIELQKAGYATDPKYAAKLENVLTSIRADLA